MALYYDLIIILGIFSILGWISLLYAVVITQKCRREELKLISNIKQDLEIARQHLEELK